MPIICIGKFFLHTHTMIRLIKRKQIGKIIVIAVKFNGKLVNYILIIMMRRSGRDQAKITNWRGRIIFSCSLSGSHLPIMLIIFPFTYIISSFNHRHHHHHHHHQIKILSYQVVNSNMH